MTAPKKADADKPVDAKPEGPVTVKTRNDHGLAVVRTTNSDGKVHEVVVQGPNGSLPEGDKPEDYKV
ncbi:MAG: hypothetical protein AAF628_08390 [Planctomycetota bacterium]